MSQPTIDPKSLEQLERQLTAALYAVWRVQGKKRKIVNPIGGTITYTLPDHEKQPELRQSSDCRLTVKNNI